VRSLEVELRQTLLLRNGRGATPTEAGKRLLEHARGILAQAERARADVDETKGASVGHVVVGLPPTVARHLTLPVVRAFREAYPRASLSIVEGLSTNIQEWLTTGRVDAALLYNPTPSPAIESHVLLEEPLCLVGPRKVRHEREGPPRARIAPARREGAQRQGSASEPRTLRAAELPRYPLIIPSRPHAIRTLVETRLAGLGLRPQVAMEIDAIPAIMELVADGYGYAVLSARALSGSAIAPRLYARTIVAPQFRSALAIVISAQRPATPLQRATIAMIERLAPEALAART
jgi:LysR family nitrogen assimilation transcriptional regulator